MKDKKRFYLSFKTKRKPEWKEQASLITHIQVLYKSGYEQTKKLVLKADKEEVSVPYRDTENNLEEKIKFMRKFFASYEFNIKEVKNVE